MTAPAQKRTYTRGELDRMTQAQLLAVADDLPKAVAEGRIVDDPPPAPPANGYAFTRSQIDSMPPGETARRASEIEEALRHNRIDFAN